MKKFISTVLALGMAASLAACGGSASTAASTESTAASAAEATADSDLATSKQGKMTIGYTVYEPMNYTDATAISPALTPSLPLPSAKSWAWSPTLLRSTGTPKLSSWTPRASTASGTA